jgi:hypothetical protein
MQSLSEIDGRITDEFCRRDNFGDRFDIVDKRSVQLEGITGKPIQSADG